MGNRSRADPALSLIGILPDHFEHVPVVLMIRVLIVEERKFGVGPADFTDLLFEQQWRW